MTEGLKAQMKERDKRLHQERVDDIEYGNKIKQTINKEIEYENKSSERRRIDQLKYKEELERQIEDANKRKMYKDVMTDYERKINKMDLMAYKNKCWVWRTRWPSLFS